jgi:hypothetical protein
MKIAVKDLRPNPFRRMKRYPIDRDKVEALKQSIKDTTFWDNLLARRAVDGDGYEIPYGHHRWLALKEMRVEEVDIPVRKLSDTDMLRIMAHENMQEWGHSTEVEQETVRAVVEAYGEDVIELPRPAKKTSELRFAPSFTVADADARTSGDAHPYTAETLGEFLGWKPYKVKATLSALALVEEELATDEQFKKLSTKQAGIIAQETRRVAKETGKPELAREVGRRLAAGMRQSHQGRDSAGRERNVKDVTIHNARLVANEMIGKQRRQDKRPKMPPINKFASDLANALADVFPTPRMQERIDAIIEYRDELGKNERRDLIGALRALAKRAEKLADKLEG